jgi:hypothetical protein
MKINRLFLLLFFAIFIILDVAVAYTVTYLTPLILVNFIIFQRMCLAVENRSMDAGFCS